LLFKQPELCPLVGEFDINYAPDLDAKRFCGAG
jgi:hypothetical protein